jgi:hypothetical protein
MEIIRYEEKYGRKNEIVIGDFRGHDVMIPLENQLNDYQSCYITI